MNKYYFYGALPTPAAPARRPEDVTGWTELNSQAMFDIEPLAFRTSDLNFASAPTTGTIVTQSCQVAPGKPYVVEFEDHSWYNDVSFGPDNKWVQDNNSPQLYSNGVGVYGNVGSVDARVYVAANSQKFDFWVPTQPGLGIIRVDFYRNGQRVGPQLRFDQNAAESKATQRAELSADLGSAASTEVWVYSENGYVVGDKLVYSDGNPQQTGAPAVIANDFSSGAFHLNAQATIVYAQLASSPKVPRVAVSMLIAGAIASGPETDILVGCGADYLNFYGAVYHVGSKRIELTVTQNGVATTSDVYYDASNIALPFWLGVVQTGTILTAYGAADGQPVTNLVTWNAASAGISFAQKSRYAGAANPDRYFALAYAGYTSKLDVKITKWRAGHFGLARLGDYGFAHYEDGKPVQQNGNYFLTGTAKPFCLPGEYQQPNSMVLEDIVKNSVDMVLAVSRASLLAGQPVYRVVAMSYKDYGDGFLWGEASPGLMYDRPANQWRLWGTAYHLCQGDSTANCRMLDATTANDLLSGITILNATATQVGRAGQVGYDSDGLRNADGSYSRMLCTKDPANEAIFWPVMVKTTDFATYTTLLNDTQSTGYEGPRACFLGGEGLLGAGGKTFTRLYRPDGSFRCTVPMPTFLANEEYASHWAVLEDVDSQGVSQYYGVSFDSMRYQGKRFCNGNAHLCRANFK